MMILSALGALALASGPAPMKVPVAGQTHDHAAMEGMADKDGKMDCCCCKGEKTMPCCDGMKKDAPAADQAGEHHHDH
ncbi:hypothetical protein GCM10022281_18190 [Sphingomonas rosea]|uniref:Uncharacterized protein n=1 Tax=Sphingomonas rosea TaxID=335605 RepID=A0ABP7U8K8_9SPHN